MGADAHSIYSSVAYLYSMAYLYANSSNVSDSSGALSHLLLAPFRPLVLDPLIPPPPASLEG